MGTRIHVFLSHDLPYFDDAAATLARLEAAIPAAHAVHDYWLAVDDSGSSAQEWSAMPPDPSEANQRRYEGPGSLWLTVTPEAACINTGGRWRGLLSIEPLRRVHLAAFRSIAAALHSPRLAICADDCDDVSDVFWDGGTQNECIRLLRATLGPPQPSIDAISPAIVQQAEEGVPAIWFLDGEAVQE